MVDLTDWMPAGNVELRAAAEALLQGPQLPMMLGRNGAAPPLPQAGKTQVTAVSRGCKQRALARLRNVECCEIVPIGLTDNGLGSRCGCVPYNGRDPGLPSTSLNLDASR
jgi:hypothetical protein